MGVVDSNGTHKLNTTWFSSQSMPADLKGTLEIASPLLDQDYVVQTSLTIGKSIKDIKLQIITDTKKHIFETNIKSKKNGGECLINIETPFIAVKKANIDFSFNFKNKFETKLAAALGDMKHSFNMKYDINQNSLVASVLSPLVPTGLVQVEATQYGNFEDGLDLTMTLKNSQEQISGALNVKKANHIILKIKTPIKGYKKMTFGASYNEKDNIDLTFGNKNDAYFAHMKAKTSIESLKTVEAEIKLPLTKFNPTMKLVLPDNEYGLKLDVEKSQYNYKMSGDVIVDAQNYGAHMNLRNKAPYEITTGLHLPTYEKHFHLRTDSSFISFLN